MTSATFRQLFQNEFPVRNDSRFVCHDSKSGETKQFLLSDIYEDIYDTFIEEYGVSSMAFEDANDYAKVNHDHDCYVSVSYEPEPLPVGLEQKDLIRFGGIGSVTVPVQVTRDWSQYAKDRIARLEPIVGEMMLIARPVQAGDVDVNSATFDGWVYPDGTQYDASRFKHQVEILSRFQNTGGTTFRVPDFRSFVKAGSGADHGAIQSYHEGHSVVKPHSHSLDYSGAQVSFDATINRVSGNNWIQNTSSGTSDSTVTHNGQYTDDVQDKNGNYTKGTWEREASSETQFSDFTIGGMSVSQGGSTDTDTQTYPSYNYIPAMVYIGKRIDQ